MIPEYSKLLAHDLTTMVKVSAFERSESVWREWLESVGFKVIYLYLEFPRGDSKCDRGRNCLDAGCILLRPDFFLLQRIDV